MKARYLFVALIVSLSTLLISCANTEEFSLRNDIHFGDSVETVKEKETMDIDYVSEYTVRSEYGTIAGIDDSYVKYSFDDDKLFEIFYVLGITLDKNNLEDNYNTIYDSLVKKYGKPLYSNSENGQYIIQTSVFDTVEYALHVYPNESNTFNHLLDYKEWVIKCNGYNVKIDLSGQYYGKDDEICGIGLSVGYKMFTNEDLEIATKEKEEQEKEEQELVDNDL